MESRINKLEKLSENEEINVNGGNIAESIGIIVADIFEIGFGVGVGITTGFFLRQRLLRRKRRLIIMNDD